MSESPNLKMASSHYLHTLLRQCSRLGLDRDEILAGLAIPEEAMSSEQARVDNKVISNLIGRITVMTEDESFGFDPAPIRRGTFALICDHIIHAQTLGEFLRRGENLCSFILQDHMKLQVSHNGESVRLNTDTYAGKNDPDRFFAEFWTMVWHRLPCWAIDERIELRQSGFAYPAPPHAEIYEQMFLCDIHFGQKHNWLEFDERYLQRPIVRTAQEIREFAGMAPRDFFALPDNQPSIRSKISLLLKEHQRNGQNFPSFDAICAQLCISPPAVRSKLNDDGTSYQKLKNRIRRDAAVDLLANSDLTIAEVADRVRFAEPAALTRAFKKWTGMSPQEYRKKLESESGLSP